MNLSWHIKDLIFENIIMYVIFEGDSVGPMDKTKDKTGVILVTVINYFPQNFLKNFTQL